MSLVFIKKINIDWINKSSSMTKYLNSRYSKVNINLIKQQIIYPSLKEKIFNFEKRKYLFKREVIIYVNNKPCIYAKSFFPIKFLVGKWKQIYFLGNKSLGNFIFKEKEIKRTPFKWFLDKKKWLVRFSSFLIQKKKIGLIEKFYPDFCKL